LEKMKYVWLLVFSSIVKKPEKSSVLFQPSRRTRERSCASANRWGSSGVTKLGSGRPLGAAPGTACGLRMYGDSPNARPESRIGPMKQFTDCNSQTVYNTKGTRAHTHRELIRKWLWEPKGSSLEYI